MSAEMFQLPLLPKVQGTWNLHAHLLKNMDFFIFLSSATGVFGNRGQSNYAAASTFQDAFAKYRISLGEKCYSLDLSLMLGIGYAAERHEITNALRKAGIGSVREKELLTVLDYCCNPNLPLPTPSESQIVIGLANLTSSSQFQGSGDSFWMNKPLFRNLRQMNASESPSTDAHKAGTEFDQLLRLAESLSEAGDIISRALVRKLSAAFMKY